MKTLVSSLLLFLTISTYAKRPNVVLLTSLKTPKIWYHSKKWRIEPTLRKIFWNRFKTSGYNIIFKDRVDQMTLRKELLNPNNIAVFWVSHSKDALNLSGGITSDSAIVDYYGNDVRDLFKNIHPNMKFLGLVGCEADAIIKNFTKEGFYSNNTNLKIHSFKKKIDARVGLRRSIRNIGNSLGFITKRQRVKTPSSKIPQYRSKDQVYSTPQVLNDFYANKACEREERFYKIEITRKLTKNAPSAAIKINKEIYDIFPAGKSGEIQYASIKIPTYKASKRLDLKLLLDSNRFESSERIYLGELSFNFDWDGRYKLFSKRDGTPLGITRNLYRFIGKMPQESDSIRMRNYSCLTN